MLSTMLVISGAMALVAGAMLHAITFMLLISGIVYGVGKIRRSEAVAGFPGNVKIRHAKLAVPALAVLIADVAIIYASHGNFSF